MKVKRIRGGEWRRRKAGRWGEEGRVKQRQQIRKEADWIKDVLFFFYSCVFGQHQRRKINFWEKYMKKWNPTRLVIKNEVHPFIISASEVYIQVYFRWMMVGTTNENFWCFFFHSDEKKETLVMITDLFIKKLPHTFQHFDTSTTVHWF